MRKDYGDSRKHLEMDFDEPKNRIQIEMELFYSDPECYRLLFIWVRWHSERYRLVKCILLIRGTAFEVKFSDVMTND